MNLKETRKLKGYTQQEISSLFTIPLRTYKRIESSQNIKNKELAEKVAKLQKKPANHGYLPKINIVIAGAGYVGLSTAFLLQKVAHITVVDLDQKRVDLINQNLSPINNKTFQKAFQTKIQFNATNNLEAYKNADVIIIAVPTNLDIKTNDLSLKNIYDVMDEIDRVNRNSLVIIRSTISIGSCSQLTRRYKNNIIFMPEFLREASAVDDAFHPTRLIFGCNIINEKVRQISKYFEKATSYSSKTFFMSYEEAESVKLFSNTYLALRISFFNELDSFATVKKMNCQNIIDGVCADPRIGDYYNLPSFGYGGYCLPKDSTQLKRILFEENLGSLIPIINKSNHERMDFIAQNIIDEAKTKSEHPNILIIEDSSKHQGNLKTVNEQVLDRLLEQNIDAKLVNQPLNEKDLDQADLIVTNSSFLNINHYRHKLYSKSKKVK